MKHYIVVRDEKGRLLTSIGYDDEPVDNLDELKTRGVLLTGTDEQGNNTAVPIENYEEHRRLPGLSGPDGAHVPKRYSLNLYPETGSITPEQLKLIRYVNQLRYDK